MTVKTSGNGEVVVQREEPVATATDRLRSTTDRLRSAAVAAPPSRVRTETVAEAASVAAEMYAPEEMEEHAQVMIDAWHARLEEKNKLYARRVRELSREQPEIAEPISYYGLYPWWNLLLAGPFQFFRPNGPFRPHKIIKHGEPAYFLAALWRNPLGINYDWTSPSACTVMTGWTFSLCLQTMNLSNVTDGPDFPNAGPLTGNFSPYCIDIFYIPIRFPVRPVQGKPDLYETNMTVDITAPYGAVPFAGYSTWIYDPDYEPPFLGIPGVPPRLQHDIPARFMVYV